MNILNPIKQLKIAIIGSSGGIGRELAALLAARQHRLFCCSRRVTASELPGVSQTCTALALDVRDETSIAGAAKAIAGNDESLDLVMVCIGVLHQSGLQPEKSLRQLDGQNFSEVMAINALGPMLVAKHFLPLMQRAGPAFFGALSARVGSIGDNRLGGWHSYRASKAALNMLIKNCAIEYRRTHPQLVIAGLHPGTVDTTLSKPFQRNVSSLFSGAFAAEQLIGVIENLTVDDSGQCFAWDGQEITP